MFSKNNLKYIFLLAIGFFWCSSVYLTQEQYLVKYASVDFINIVELLFGSFSMAIGILLYGILDKHGKVNKVVYLIFMLLSIISMTLFFFIKNKYVMGALLCTTCFFGTAGFGAGYHFNLISLNVLKEYRARVFALGYGLGSIGTYLMVLLPEKIYNSKISLAIYVPVVLLNIFLILKATIKEKVKSEKYTKSLKSYLVKISIVVLVMSLLSALATDAISVYTIDIAGGYGNTRIYYCLGLFIAGILADKRIKLFDVVVMSSFIFALLSIVLLKEGYSIGCVAAISYFFVGFFVVFRTITFVNLSSQKKSLAFMGAFGLMYSRIMEGLLVLFEDKLIDNITLLIILMFVVLAIAMVLFFMLYFQNNNVTETDVLKSIVVKYKLSNQEEKVLNLLIKGKTNQEIADELFISVFTVKRHVSSIYEKTNMKKKELIEKCYLRTI